MPKRINPISQAEFDDLFDSAVSLQKRSSGFRGIAQSIFVEGRTQRETSEQFGKSPTYVNTVVRTVGEAYQRYSIPHGCEIVEQVILPAPMALKVRKVSRQIREKMAHKNSPQSKRAGKE